MESKYFIILNGKLSGPFNSDELSKFKLSYKTKLCLEGTNSWKQIGEFEELNGLCVKIKPELPLFYKISNKIKDVLDSILNLKLFFIVLSTSLLVSIVFSVFEFVIVDFGDLRVGSNSGLFFACQKFDLEKYYRLYPDALKEENTIQDGLNKTKKTIDDYQYFLEQPTFEGELEKIEAYLKENQYSSDQSYAKKWKRRMELTHRDQVDSIQYKNALDSNYVWFMKSVEVDKTRDSLEVKFLNLNGFDLASINKLQQSYGRSKYTRKQLVIINENFNFVINSVITTFFGSLVFLIILFYLTLIVASKQKNKMLSLLFSKSTKRVLIYSCFLLFLVLVSILFYLNSRQIPEYYQAIEL